MSGIAGIIRFDGGLVETGPVEAMTAAMTHRGPDGIRHWQGAGVALGHCRLCTTPESLEEIQPLTNADESLVLVLDGRVDNWEELRKRLLEKGARLRTRTDAELVLAAYEIWGEGCAAQIDGDFAFVIWDARARRAFCGLDRTGARSLFYHWGGDRLIFATELKPVLEAQGGPRAFNEQILAETLAARWLTRGQTLWQGVEQLIPAQTMTVAADGLRTARYWFPEDIPLTRFKTDADYVEHYREVFLDTVRRMSRAIGPVGASVSGGLDSSAVFAAACRLHDQGRLPAGDVRGYTLQFAEGTDAYELDYAHAVGAHLGRRIEEVPPEIRGLAWLEAEAAKAAVITNQPNGIMHWGELQRLHAAGGRAYLTGFGGDQFLAAAENDLAEALRAGAWSAAARGLGEDRRAFGLARAAWRVPRRGLFPMLPVGVRSAVRRAVRHSRGEAETGGFWLVPHLRALFEARYRAVAGEEGRRNQGLRIGLRERLFHLDSPGTLALYGLMNGMASRAGVEYRAPMFSKAYVEMALGLSLWMLRRGRVTRWVHRQAMRDLLPEKVRNRAGKAVFLTVSQPCVAELSEIQLEEYKAGSAWIVPKAFARVQRQMLNSGGSLRHWPFGMLLFFALCNAINRTNIDDL